MAACISCGNNPMDLSGANQLMKINKIITDDITVIIVSIISIALLSIVIWYFIGQLISSIKRWRGAYKRNNEGIKSVSEDNEIYDDDGVLDNNTKSDPMKADFLRTMENTYKDYNKEKTDYITTTYSRINDDVIDQDTLYKKYDDYSYKNE